MSKTNGKGDAWKNRHHYKSSGVKKEKQPRVLKVEPQVTLDEVYMSPLKTERQYEVTRHGEGEPQITTIYVPRNLPQPKPTGVRVMDEYVAYLAAGHSNLTDFCNQRGLRLGDLDSLVFVLTGMRGVVFRQRYQVRMMDELLRYTSLTPAEVAHRCGLGKAFNLYQITKREYNEAPMEHRKNIREKGDEGRYA